jgi:hypothetical protein
VWVDAANLGTEIGERLENIEAMEATAVEPDRVS